MRDLETFYGPNAGYVLEHMSDIYKIRRVSMPRHGLFLIHGRKRMNYHLLKLKRQNNDSTPLQVSHVVAASNLAHAIRARGHLGAHLDPLGTEPLGDPALLPETHGITDEDLAQLPPT